MASLLDQIGPAQTGSGQSATPTGTSKQASAKKARPKSRVKAKKLTKSRNIKVMTPKAPKKASSPPPKGGGGKGKEGGRRP
tara:strand:+ start:2374 stop:2616 length:243 start_codon:yes stop_codon:yes gene_type:complete